MAFCCTMLHAILLHSESGCQRLRLPPLQEATPLRQNHAALMGMPSLQCEPGRGLTSMQQCRLAVLRGLR